MQDSYHSNVPGQDEETTYNLISEFLEEQSPETKEQVLQALQSEREMPSDELQQIVLQQNLVLSVMSFAY